MPLATPPTTQPAGGKIKPAPILVIIINDNINKLANVDLFSLDLTQKFALFNFGLAFGI